MEGQTNNQTPLSRILSLEEGGKCHIKGCNNTAEFTCSCVYFFKQYGCKKRMCSEHKSKKWFASESKYKPPPDVCVECEDKVKSCSNKALGIPFALCGIICLVICSIFIIRGILIGGFDPNVCRLVNMKPEELKDVESRYGDWNIMTLNDYKKHKKECDEALPKGKKAYLYDSYFVFNDLN